ncbi:MAG: hypothetical protein NTY02_09305 [Acidobacteria bacterium]|nr:hypothetical protein [Acidobacteriota bacterium]
MRHIPYWITYRADLDQTPPGSVIVLPDNNILDGVDGAMLAQRGLAAIIMTADNADYLCHPNLYDTYLAGLQARLVAKGITPVGFMPGEEWWDRCNNPADIMGWPCLAGTDMMERKTFILPRLRVMVQRITARWPWCPTIGVETKWNEDQGFGAGLWYPDYGTDVLGLDSYLAAHGWSLIGTPPLTDQTDAAMRQKFAGEVASMLTGAGDARRAGVPRDRPGRNVGHGPHWRPTAVVVRPRAATPASRGPRVVLPAVGGGHSRDGCVTRESGRLRHDLGRECGRAGTVDARRLDTRPRRPRAATDARRTLARGAASWTTS